MVTFQHDIIYETNGFKHRSYLICFGCFHFTVSEYTDGKETNESAIRLALYIRGEISERYLVIKKDCLTCNGASKNLFSYFSRFKFTELQGIKKRRVNGKGT